MARKRQISRRVSASGWTSLHEPIGYPTQDFANAVFFIAVLMFLAVWIAPYWKTAGQEVALLLNYESQVLGASTEKIVIAPEWYYTGEAAVAATVDAFAAAGTELFDISESVSEAAEFYEPGVDTVWNAWLELMAEP